MYSFLLTTNFCFFYVLTKAQDTMLYGLDCLCVAQGSLRACIARQPSQLVTAVTVRGGMGGGGGEGWPSLATTPVYASVCPHMGEGGRIWRENMETGPVTPFQHFYDRYYFKPAGQRLYSIQLLLSRRLITYHTLWVCSAVNGKVSNLFFRQNVSGRPACQNFFVWKAITNRTPGFN